MRIEFIVRCVGKDGGDAVVMGMKVVVVVARRRWCRLLLLWWWWQRRIWWGLMVVVVKEMGGEGGRRARGREKGIKKKSISDPHGTGVGRGVTWRHVSLGLAVD